MKILDASRFLPALIKANASSEFAVTTVHALQCARKQPQVQPWKTSEAVPVYVNHGRWVANCSYCNSGIAVLFGKTQGWCFGCGAVFTNVTWPNDTMLQEILTLLEARPAAVLQNWYPNETIDQLRAQNDDHGL